VRHIRVGIPKALLYYKYGIIWNDFFGKLGVETLFSIETDYEIIRFGESKSVDEMCFSLKIFLGHVSSLIGKCDYILIPRIVNYGSNKKVCTNFNALYDVCNNIFDAKFITYNVNYRKFKYEWYAYCKLGISLGYSFRKSLFAYLNAKKSYKKYLKNEFLEQNKLLNTSKIKILLVSHPYNSYDALIGKNIVKILNSIGVDVIYADKYYGKKTLYKEISKTLYWKYSQEILNGLIYYKDSVDGILFLSTFPCGSDSLCNELCLRKIDKPKTTIVIDNVNGDAGIITRLESFVDIIKLKKGGLNE